MRVADHGDLFASFSSVCFVAGLDLHDELGHGRDVILSDVLEIVVEESFFVTNWVQVCVRDGVARASDATQVDIVAELEESGGQEGLIRVSTRVIELAVSVFSESAQEEYRTLRPLVWHLLALLFTKDSEQSEFIAVSGLNVVRLPEVVLAPIFEGLLDLWVVPAISAPSPGGDQTLSCCQRKCGEYDFHNSATEHRRV